MKFEMPAGAEIEIADTADAAEAVRAVCSDAAMTAEIEALAKGEYYERFQTWDDMRDETARKIAAVLMEQGREAAEDFISDKLVDEYHSGAENFFHENMTSHSREFGRFMDALIDPIEEATGASRDAVSELLVEALKDRICEALENADGSKPFDIVPGHVRVETFRILGADDASDPEELALSEFVSNVMSLQSLMPGDNLKHLFEGANVAIDDFVAHIKAEHGIDLRGGPKDKKLIEWLASGDYIVRGRDPQDPRMLSNAAARALAWQTFAPKTDPDRPAVLTPAKLETVLTESGYGGLPVYVCRMALADMIEFDWTQPMTMAPMRGQEKQSGGFVGVYNPWNGSGDIQEVEAPMQLPAGREGWKVSGVYGTAVDDCFGIVPHYYYAAPKAPAPTIEVEPEAAPAPRP